VVAPAAERIVVVELEPSPVTAEREETAHNPRARSAKLRVLARQEAA